MICFLFDCIYMWSSVLVLVVLLVVLVLLTVIEEVVIFQLQRLVLSPSTCVRFRSQHHQLAEVTQPLIFVNVQ